MAYLLYSIGLIVLVFGTALFLTRSHWLPYLPIPETLYHRLPSTFSSDLENGFSSSAFDLSANILSGDSRAGLDDAAKKAIQRIMKKRKCNFDEGRRIYMQERFEREGIAPDGRPRDPKFVSFS